MAHALEIADEAYQALIDAARDRGKTPQHLLEQLLLDLSQRVSSQDVQSASESESSVDYDPAKDALASFLGAFETDVPDVVRRHDHYLAQTYVDTHTSK